ncbi:MAG: glycosyltransferase [Ignavibacteria bacterium]|nr:glycosyltransferase [Ignavibacteria bacterium]
MNKIEIVHIISNLSLGGAQTLLFDIVKFLKMREDIEISVIALDSGEFIEMFQEDGIKVIDLKEKGLINIKVLLKLIKILKDMKPDIVHTHLLKADFYGRIAAKQTGIPLIYSTCHNYSSHHKGADIDKTSVFDLIDNFVVSYSGSNLIAISEIVKKYLVNRNRKFKDITEVIYNGVNIEKEKFKLNGSCITDLRNEYGISNDDFVITILGRLETQKGHGFFIDSIKDFLREKKNVKVLLLGEGNLRSEIEIKIKENDLTDYIQILGFQTETEKFIEISNLICVPSLWEGFGLVIIEGMIKKKIVLASDAGGIPEIITDGKTGFLFEVKNKESFLKKINFIYDNFDDFSFIRENALKLVKDKFDIRYNSELYYQSYLRKINALKDL